MATIPSQKSWYSGKKKPKLQIKILQEILNHGELSKVRFESQYQDIHYHPDILKGFENLKKHGLIEQSRKLSRRGRDEILYTLSTNGLQALFSENPNPRNFWNSLVLWVYNQKNSITWHCILELLDLYLKKYLKHYLEQGYYSLQLDEFNFVCNLWFRKAILPKRKISTAQKVLEVLAINPGLTLDQISQAIGERVSTVESIIKMYTPIPHKPVLVDVYGHHDGPFYDTREWRFQIHNAIVQSQSSKRTFNLTIFGVLMVLYIILKNHEGNMPHGLMEKYDTNQYIDRIANNYKCKIPLIFEKWSFVKSCLKEYSYLNFKIILDRNLREKSFNDSVQDGGNKELYVGMKETILASQKQLMDLQTAGMNVIFNFHPAEDSNITKDVSKKIQHCFHLISYLSTVVHPTDYDSESFTSMFGNENYLGTELAKEIGSFYEVGHLEKSLSFEISFIYYLSLRTRMLFSNDKFSPVYFEQILTKIMSDKEIGEFISKHLGMIQSYYQEVHNAIGTIY